MGPHYQPHLILCEHGRVRMMTAYSSRVTAIEKECHLLGQQPPQGNYCSGADRTFPQLKQLQSIFLKVGLSRLSHRLCHRDQLTNACQ